MRTQPDLQVYRLERQHKDWSYCCSIRTQVFIEEQQVPSELEWDAADMIATHLLGLVSGRPVACARILPDGHVGRMAVLPNWRGQGVGAVILREAIQVCKDLRVIEVKLSAQVHAIGFYKRAGFSVVSTPYLDANIAHVDMRLKLI